MPLGPLAALLPLLLGAPERARADSITTPIDERVVQGLRAVEVEDVAAAPRTSASANARPRARLNVLFHANDGSGRVFVNDMRGRLYVMTGGVISPTPFLDLAAARGAAFLDTNTASNSEQGFSSFAFHPDFAIEGAPGYGLVYTVSTETTGSGTATFGAPYTAPENGGAPTHHDVLAEWRVDPADPSRVDPTSRREILRIAQPLVDHNMNLAAFNPNARPGDADYGKLYIGVGDGGNTFNVASIRTVGAGALAQDLSVPFGKILRIDPLGANDADPRPYAIPTDNPFAADGDDATLGEVWAYGLRNPQRFSWDTGGDGVMLIADIGQKTAEEVNIGVAGANYGWPFREGMNVPDRVNQAAHDLLPADDEAYGYAYPAAQYGRADGIAITGGFVYRGDDIPYLFGRYVFGDLSNGRIFSVAVEDLALGANAPIEELTLLRGGVKTTLLAIVSEGLPSLDFRTDLRIGTDEEGEIYLITKRDGEIRRLAFDAATGALFPPVPEPGAAALALLGGATVLVRRRRRAAGAPTRALTSSGACGRS